MTDVNAEKLVNDVEALHKEFYDRNSALSLARQALGAEENKKVKEIHDLVAQFKGVALDEEVLEEVEDYLRDMASTLDMNTEYMEIDLAEGHIEMWQNSYC